MRSSTLHIVGDLEREGYEVRVYESADDSNTTPQPVQWLGWSSESGVKFLKSAYAKPDAGRRIGKVGVAGSYTRNFAALKFVFDAVVHEDCKDFESAGDETTETSPW